MPCSSGYSQEEDSSRLLRKLDRATRAACDLANSLRNQLSERSLELRGAVSEETYRWVLRHDRLDRERKEREEAEKKKQLIRRRALEKLSSKERAALGL